jgi:translation elongation factor EF-1alpha
LILAHAFGIRQLIICVNKLDDESIAGEESQAQFEKIRRKLGSLLRLALM